MRRTAVYCLVGCLSFAGGILAFWLIQPRDSEIHNAAARPEYTEPCKVDEEPADFDVQIDDIPTGGGKRRQSHGGLTIVYPLNGTLFPPEIIAPTLDWIDGNAESDTWLVTVEFQDGAQGIRTLARSNEWTPSEEQWEEIKWHSREKPATVTVSGIDRHQPKQIISNDSVSIRTSQDEVGAPLFYREVNLPFIDAVKDPTRIRWRFGPISSPRPPVILEKLPVCGNCHSFSANGEILGMDVDYANTRGSYVITQVAEKMSLATSDVITWNDYKKEDQELTLGLLSQVSPNGRYVVSTVKDRSVFAPKDGLAFSQIFFPVKGILCIYDRQTREFRELPGADDRHYVQSNPVWSPDGKYITFARSESYELKRKPYGGKALLSREDVVEFVEDGRPFRFDLYQIPFNDGKGGEPKPLEGASHNGLSNYFARYSPNGKWIVFCKAKNYMLLQPDSELYIIPATGGKARRLRCNTYLMNSWHSWSPNSRWLVFSSKANSPYTQLFLTHIDDDGRSTPPVVLSHFTDLDRAANIPEFVNVDSDAIQKIHEQFLDDNSYVRAGDQFYKARDYDNAIEKYEMALDLNPDNLEAHLKLTLLYFGKGMDEQRKTHHARARALCKTHPGDAYHAAVWLMSEKRYAEVAFCLSMVLDEASHDLIDKQLLVEMHHKLGVALCYGNAFEKSAAHLSEAVRLDPDDAEHHYRLALALACQGNEGTFQEALEHYEKAKSLQPDIQESALLHRVFATRYAQAGQSEEAVAAATRALDLARADGDQKSLSGIKQELQLYRQGRQLPHSDGPDSR